MAKSRELRRAQLVSFINKNGSVSFDQIKEEFPSFSEPTLRLDLRDLDAANQIVRSYGGARSVEHATGVDAPITNRMSSEIESKQEVARKAVKLLHPNSTVFLDSGSTTTIFCRAMPSDIACTFFTESLTCAYELARLENSRLIMPGGKLNRETLTLEGSRSIDALQSIHFDQLFLATTAYSEDAGFTCEVDAQAIIKRTLIAHSGEVIMLVDSSKFGQGGTFRFCGLSDIDIIVSDGGLPPAFVERCHEAGVVLL